MQSHTTKSLEDIAFTINFLHGLGPLTCSGIDALPPFPGKSTVSSSSRFVVEGVFRGSVVIHPFNVADSILFAFVILYRGAGKSLAQPGRKQSNVSVRMASISFCALPCRKINLMTARVSMLLKSRASLTCFRACLLPGRAKDVSAPRYFRDV